MNKRFVIALLWILSASSFIAAESSPSDKPTLVVVVGAAGEEEFGAAFSQWAGLWEKGGTQAGFKVLTIGLGNPKASVSAESTGGSAESSEPQDRERLEKALAAEPKDGGDLWLVLIGHGTFDGKEAKFNLRGPDFSATDLASWLQAFHRPVAVINTGSASAPFIGKLSAAGRVIITATRSGHEQNYARFGQYLAEAISNPEADLDKDGQTSLLEAFLMASRRVAQFYQVEGRLATEHPLVDDNGDGLGTPADWFRGIRAVKKAKDGAALDGLRCHQFHLLRNEAERNLPAASRSKRDELERAISELRESKSQFEEEEYYRRLEPLLLEMARLYQSIENGQAGSSEAGGTKGGVGNP